MENLFALGPVSVRQAMIDILENITGNNTLLSLLDQIAFWWKDFLSFLELGASFCDEWRIYLELETGTEGIT